MSCVHSISSDGHSYIGGTSVVGRSLASLIGHAPVALRVHGDGGLLPVVEDAAVRAGDGGRVAAAAGQGGPRPHRPRRQRRRDVRPHRRLDYLHRRAAPQRLLVTGGENTDMLTNVSPIHNS